jgi:hypothetical protein
MRHALAGIGAIEEGSYSIAIRAPYRLDLTVNVLRRLSTNLVDVLTPDGAYLRRLGDAGHTQR